jgi:anti-anti-sigma factor
MQILKSLLARVAREKQGRSRWQPVYKCSVQEDVTPTHPAHHTPRPSAASPAVQVSLIQTAPDLVIRIKGEATAQSVGVLLAGLLAPSACRPAVVTLDLSELRSISCLAMGVLVAYRRSVVRTGGRVRLAEELQPAVHEALARGELLGLFEATAEDGPTSDLQASV